MVQSSRFWFRKKGLLPAVEMTPNRLSSWPLAVISNEVRDLSVQDAPRLLYHYVFIESFLLQLGDKTIVNEIFGLRLPRLRLRWHEFGDDGFQPFPAYVRHRLNIVSRFSVRGFQNIRIFDPGILLHSANSCRLVPF